VRIALVALAVLIAGIAFLWPLVVKGKLPYSRPAAPAAGQQGPPPSRARSEDVRLVVKDFYREVRSEGGDQLEATVRGESAILAEDKVYTIVAPVVESVVQVPPGSLTQAGPQKVHLTARGAVYDEEHGRLLLYNSVRTEGEDFEILTDSVTYALSEHSVKSSAAVEMRRYRLGPDNERELSMSVVGKGLDVDLTTQKIVIPLEPRARLVDVTEEFFASGMPAEAEQGPQQVVITADGSMTYEHTADRVTFRDNVVVVSGEKKLTADRLEISLGQSEGAERLRVTRVAAKGNVVFSFSGQVARGRELVWEDVTQAGTLSGNPARLDTPEFRLTGRALTFVRLRDRFQADGPGALLWLGRPDAAQEKGRHEPAPAGQLVSPASLVSDAPVEVTWSGGMTYAAADKVATFTGKVRATQQDTTLTCETLELGFDTERRTLQQGTARGNVVVTQGGDPPRTIRCDRAVWHTEGGEMELSASNGRSVTVVSGTERLVTTRAVFDPAAGSFRCPAAGRLVVAGGRLSQAGQGPRQVVVSWQRSMQYSPEPARHADAGGVRRADAARQGYRPDERSGGGASSRGGGRGGASLAACGYRAAGDVRPARPPAGRHRLAAQGRHPCGRAAEEPSSRPHARAA